jgi:hypothetical protein
VFNFGGEQMTATTHQQTRRIILQAAASLAAAPFSASAAKAIESSEKKMKINYKAKPGEFDFLNGEWKIHHRRLKNRANNEWDIFEGEATCWSILGGVGSIEELRIPARNFSGMGLRLLDVENQQWSDFWVNAASGILNPPPVIGGFVQGDGIFISDELDAGVSIKIRGVWDQITPKSCRWQQAISRDNGKTWDDNWVMEWQRVR